MIQRDRNTRYFHTKTVIRRRKNRISMLKNNQGEWEEDVNAIKRMSCDYFQGLFTEDINERMQLNLNNQFHQFSNERLARLDSMSTMEELKTALFSMGGLKAPGEDGFPAIFFQKNWLTVKESMFQVVLKIFKGEFQVDDINQTIIVLVPKFDKP